MTFLLMDDGWMNLKVIACIKCQSSVAVAYLLTSPFLADSHLIFFIPFYSIPTWSLLPFHSLWLFFSAAGAEWLESWRGILRPKDRPRVEGAICPWTRPSSRATLHPQVHRQPFPLLWHRYTHLSCWVTVLAFSSCVSCLASSWAAPAQLFGHLASWGVSSTSLRGVSSTAELRKLAVSAVVLIGLGFIVNFMEDLWASSPSCLSRWRSSLSSSQPRVGFTRAAGASVLWNLVFLWFSLLRPFISQYFSVIVLYSFSVFYWFLVSRFCVV